MTGRIGRSGDDERESEMTDAEKWWCCTCGRDPCDGLDCGVYLPGQAPRRKPAPKSAEEMRAIRAKAWKTRRARLAARKPSAVLMEGSE